MYCAALSTGIRLLAKCFSRPPVVGTPRPISSSLHPSDFSASIDNLVKPKSNVNVNVVSSVETYKHDFIGETFGKAAIKSMSTSMGRADGRTKAAKPVVVASNISCRVRGAILETRGKVLKPVQVTNPIAARKSAEEAELEELVEKVRRMYEELERSKNETKISSRIPAYEEPSFEDFVQEKTHVQPIQKTQQCSVQPEWMETAEVVEIAMRITRCNDMTVEGVDEALRDINIRMNAMIDNRAKTVEERSKWMEEAAHKMREYAEVLLESECEVKLAVERARVRAAGLRHVGDVEYLASLAPGSSHVPECDLLCTENYLPRRAVGLEYEDSEPGLSTEGSSRSTSPSLDSAPGTPRSSNADLPEVESALVIQGKPHELLPTTDISGGIPYNAGEFKFKEEKNSKTAQYSVRESDVVVGSVWRPEIAVV